MICFDFLRNVLQRFFSVITEVAFEAKPWIIFQISTQNGRRHAAILEYLGFYMFLGLQWLFPSKCWIVIDLKPYPYLEVSLLSFLQYSNWMSEEFITQSHYFFFCSYLLYLTHLCNVRLCQFSPSPSNSHSDHVSVSFFTAFLEHMSFFFNIQSAYIITRIHFWWYICCVFQILFRISSSAI